MGQILVDREALVSELQKVFDVRTAQTLLDVLDKVAAQVLQAGVSREDFSELKRVMMELAEEVKKLVEAQVRSEARLSGIEARLSGVEGRMDRVEAAIERLTEVQMRSEISAVEHRKATAKLEKSIDQLRQQVGGLSETVGGDIEDVAYIVLHDVLRREFGWHVGPLERTWQNWDTEPEEVEVFGTATDPTQSGRMIWIVGEAKHNLTVREVERFSKQVERARQHLKGEVFAVCFCYRARPEVQEQVRAAGLRLVFSYGKLQ
jgi:hypothetical protein